MEESTLPLESLTFWSGSVRPGEPLKVRVEDGALLHVNGACVLDESSDRPRAILKVKCKGGRIKAPATLCVLKFQLRSIPSWVSQLFFSKEE